MKTLYVGKVLTMAEPLYADAVLEEDGIICGVGRAEELRKKAGDCREEHLDGGVLLPGFIDPHSHFSQMASACLQASLDGAETVEEMGEKIRAFLRETKPAPGAWVSARDYDNNRMPGLRNPTLEELDALAPGHPFRAGAGGPFP